jgi:hypothetical protein
MSHTQETSQPRPADTATTDDRGRRWFHLRPEPRRRSDLGGVNSTWWTVLVWIAVILLAVFPYPWWW